MFPCGNAPALKRILVASQTDLGTTTRAPPNSQELQSSSEQLRQIPIHLNPQILGGTQIPASIHQKPIWVIPRYLRVAFSGMHCIPKIGNTDGMPKVDAMRRGFSVEFVRDAWALAQETIRLSAVGAPAVARR